MTSAIRVGRALWWVLAASWIVRLAGLTIGTTALWGVDAAAYLPAWFAWTTWALVGVALFPPMGAALTQGLARIGHFFDAPSMEKRIGLFATVAVGLLCLPDRVGFTGDFLLRLSSARASGSPTTIFPQALPLDLLLHYTIPHQLARLRIAPVEVTSRVFGALEAGCFALLVVTLVRRAGLRGAALATTGLIILAGAPLAIFTGLNKAFTELVVIATLLVVNTMPGPYSFGRAVRALAMFSLALALHRVALLFAPMVVFELVGWFKIAAPHESRLRRFMVLTLVPLTIVLGCRALVPVARIDLPHGLLWPLHAASRASPGVRLLDLANLLEFIAPTLVLLPALLLDSDVRGDLNGAGGLWYACLVIPSALLVALIDAPQGYFRDWDMFAIAGLLLTVVCSLEIGRFLARTRESTWLGAAVVLSTLMPCVQTLVLQSDDHAGLQRVAAFAEARPRRSTELRASVLAFLGKRAWDSGDIASAGTYGRRAAELVPTRSTLTLWAEAEELQGRFGAAESIYVRLVTTSPGYLRAWLGLAHTRLESGRLLEAAVAAESALAIDPRSASGAKLLRDSRREPAVRRQ